MVNYIVLILIVGQLLWWAYVLRHKYFLKEFPNGQNWVLFASQSGQAEQVARDTIKTLSQQSQHWQIATLDNWYRQNRLDKLNGLTVLFIVSTQGDGDPPDNAIKFIHFLHEQSSNLTKLEFAILGLGDTNYPYFCGFAYHLQSQLEKRQAKEIFPITTVDKLNQLDLQKWTSQIRNQYSISTEFINSTEKNTKTRSKATLYSRQCLTPQNLNHPMFLVVFSLDTEVVDWQAGDIAEVIIPNDSGEVIRSYTIANLPSASQLELCFLIRQISTTNGVMGKGSGYLTQQMKLGQEIELSIRCNPSFHLSTIPCPIIFIGTGSGLAGLLALLEEAQNQWGSNPSHWLIYGERHKEVNNPCHKKIRLWQQQGVLNQVDLCFSQEIDESHPRYVQEVMQIKSKQLADWINNKKAMIYLCGSHKHLAKSIPQTLISILGEEKFELFLAENRFRQDIY